MTTVEATAGTRDAPTLLRRGGWAKADIRTAPHGPGQAIHKDFSAKAWPVRLAGRAQVAAEVRSLQRLRGVRGIPACYGMVGRHGLLMERIDGERITRWCRLHPDGAASMFEQLVELVERMHARGVYHLDLRKRDNILVTPAGRPCIIDFNASLRLTPGSLAARCLAPILRRVDHGAILKWKARLAPGLLTEAEGHRYRRESLLRRLWIFN